MPRKEVEELERKKQNISLCIHMEVWPKSDRLVYLQLCHRGIKLQITAQAKRNQV